MAKNISFIESVADFDSKSDTSDYSLEGIRMTKSLLYFDDQTHVVTAIYFFI